METIADYLDYQTGILDSIQKHGASMSHHHGIGKMTAPWLEGQIGANQLDVFKALKRHFDPNNIMNPGGTLAPRPSGRSQAHASTTVKCTIEECISRLFGHAKMRCTILCIAKASRCGYRAAGGFSLPIFSGSVPKA